MTITTDDLVRREVFYCVSSLVHTLATSYGAGTSLDALDALTEQAFDLSTPVPDYVETAIEAGFAQSKVDGKWINTRSNKFCFATAEEACSDAGLEPGAGLVECEVFEHWIVSDWLADKLEARGEKVDRDFAGMTIWARTTTGQAISMDYVIEQIVADLNKPVAA
jgi:hypothetical protein